MRRTLSLLTAAVLGAVAMAALTFGPRPAPGAMPTDVPSSPRTVTVARADIRSVVVLAGVIAPSQPVAVRAPVAGAVSQIAPLGEPLAAGQLLASIDDGSGGSTEVSIADAGTLLDWQVDNEQLVAVGQVIATMAPSTFDAVATVPAEILYRFYESPNSATVSLDHGPAPFPCEPLTTGAVSSGGDPLNDPVHARCTVPDGVRVFAGVRLRLAIVTGQRHDVLTVPLEAVAGTADQGWVTLASNHERRVVRLGMSDGVKIEIVEGLAAGDTILVPPEALPQDILVP